MRAFTPFPFEPNLVASHSAPVLAFDRRSHFDKKHHMNTWLNTGHSHGIQILFIPYTKQSATIHIVPLISNISEASLRPKQIPGQTFTSQQITFFILSCFFAQHPTDHHHGPGRK